MKETTNGLRAARKAARLTQAELAELAGTTGATINKLETGTRKLTVEWAQRLSSHLGIAPLALFSENVSPYDTRDGEQTFVAVHSLKIRGEIGAGVWMLKELAPFRIEQEVSAVSGKWQVFSQIAFRHRGDGMTAARIYDGDCVIVVDYSEAKRGLTDGDLVVIERERGELVERSCKRLEIREDGFAFHNATENRTFREVVQCGPDMKEPDGTTIGVLGFVISVTRFVM